MEIDQLQYFLDIADTLSFSEAAKKNHISQPAISNSIVSLERQLNTKLFNRDTHSVTLTQDGRILQQYAKDILRSFEIASSKIRNTSSYQGQVIMSITSGLQTEIADCIESFMKTYPGISLNTRFNMSFAISMADSTNEICFGYIFGNSYENTKHRIYKLKDDKLILAYPLKWFENESFNLNKLGDRPYFIINSLLNKDLYNAEHMICEAYGFYPKVRGYCDTDEILLNYVNKGIGFGIIPSSSLTEEKYHGVGQYEFTGELSELEFCCSVQKGDGNFAVELFLDILNKKYGFYEK